MLKTVTLAATAALIFVSAVSAQADEYLETTGNRGAIVSAQPAAASQLRNLHLDVRGKVPQADVARTDIPGQGG
jgi:hypothetical protein